MTKNKLYFNYHSHTYYSNVSTIDCVVSYEEYAKRSIELGHKWLSSCEHGGTFANVECFNVAKKYGLKFISAGEFYFVPDRFQKDRSNYHIILVAKTKNAMRELNYIMSEANATGFYGRPRIDLELLRGLPKGEVYCTTACTLGIFKDYPNTKNIFLELIDIFGENLFLEVQAHEIDRQVEYNKHMKELSLKYNIKLIAGCDSHAINTDEYFLRDYLIASKGLRYEGEEGWNAIDYPTYDTLKNRFMQQGIWNESEVENFIANTLILTDTEDIKIDTKIKVPTVFPDKTREWKLNHLKEIIFRKWSEYKYSVDSSMWDTYVHELLAEYSVIEETNMEDYFVTNYYIIKRGIELGGILTKTGRGSGASYLINFILGFTTIDRLQFPLPLLRERFMGKARILENNSAPDID